MPARRLDPEIDRLYRLPLDEFTAARNALAKRAGDDASEVRGLQKPPVAAWAINNVYWRRRDVYDSLVDAATELRKAHAAALSGKRSDLRVAGKAHEQTLETALKAALGVLRDAGHPATDAIRHAIATTLRGLPADAPPGRLTRTLQPGGFEMLAGIPVRERPAERRTVQTVRGPAARGAREAEPEKKAKPGSRAVTHAKEALVRATRALGAADQASRREEFEAARAARESERAGRALHDARQALEAAQRAVDEAQHDAASAERKREAAERRARALDEARGAARLRVEAAEADLERLANARR